MACPETASAVQTMPAMAMTKNMPVVPDTPKRSRTAEETMMVSIVIPETGLRAVVAMALAATEVKKNEKTSIRPRPAATTAVRVPRLAKKAAAATAVTTTPRRIDITEMSRSVRSRRGPPSCRKALSAMPKEPATIRSDFRIPKIPAVAMAPTPTNRT